MLSKTKSKYKASQLPGPFSLTYSVSRCLFIDVGGVLKLTVHFKTCRRFWKLGVIFIMLRYDNFLNLARSVTDLCGLKGLLSLREITYIHK